MINIMSILLLLLAIFGKVKFDTKASTAAMVAILAIAAISLSVLGKKSGKKLFKFLSYPIVLCALVFTLYTKPVAIEGGSEAFQKKCSDIAQYLEDGELKKAKTALDSLKEKYPEEEIVRILETTYLIENGEASDAYNSLGRYENKNSRAYYSMKEVCMQAYGEDRFSARDFMRLYMDAVSDNPDWSYASYNAGLFLLGENEFGQAENYFRMAYDNCEPNVELAYRLGAVCCEQRKYAEGAEFFEEACNLGADEELVANMLWYLEKAE